MASKATAIENASDVIEAFGGIRPMAKKMDVAVTTVQGWKKRDVIPAKRLEQIIAAAQAHDVDLTGVLPDGDSGDSGAAASAVPSAAVSAEDDKASDDDAPIILGDEITAEDRDEQTDTSERAAHDEHDVVGADGKSAAEAIIPELTALKQKLEAAETLDKIETVETQAKPRTVAQQQSHMATMMSAAILILGMVAIGLFLYQKDQSQKAELARLEAEMQQKLAAVTQDVDSVKKDQGFFGQIIPKDLTQQIEDLKQKADNLQTDVNNATEQAKIAAKAVSDDVLAKDAGTMKARLTKLDAHIKDATGSPVLEGLITRYASFSANPAGQSVMDESVRELDALFGAMEDAGVGAGEGGQAAVNETLDAARQQSEALSQSFASVPQQDLKAAAMLLGMAQLRSTLNRDEANFESDLALLQKLAGEDNVDLTAALDRLAPHAQSGVLTPSGLSSELRSFAGDAVVASLQGEDVSLKEQASARLNEVLQVEKDGELISGNATQASIARADNLLQQGDIAGAIASIKGIDGAAGAQMLPWLEDAQTSLDAQSAQQLLGQLLSVAGGSGGTMIEDAQSGTKIFVPLSGPAKLP